MTLQPSNTGANKRKDQREGRDHEINCSLHISPERKTSMPIMTEKKKRNPTKTPRGETRSAIHHGPTNKRTETPHHLNLQEIMRVEKLIQPSAGLKGRGE